jgi:hypothetical protein
LLEAPNLVVNNPANNDSDQSQPTPEPQEQKFELELEEEPGMNLAPSKTWTQKKHRVPARLERKDRHMRVKPINTNRDAKKRSIGGTVGGTENYDSQCRIAKLLF